MDQGSGHLFIITRSSHFFNKADFGQYLFNKSILADKFEIKTGLKEQKTLYFLLHINHVLSALEKINKINK